MRKPDAPEAAALPAVEPLIARIHAHAEFRSEMRFTTKGERWEYEFVSVPTGMWKELLDALAAAREREARLTAERDELKRHLAAAYERNSAACNARLVERDLADAAEQALREVTGNATACAIAKDGFVMADTNMYGVTPCPKCGSVFRRPTQRMSEVQCGDCGLIEPRELCEVTPANLAHIREPTE